MPHSLNCALVTVLLMGMLSACGGTPATSSDVPGGAPAIEPVAATTIVPDGEATESTVIEVVPTQPQTSPTEATSAAPDATPDAATSATSEELPPQGKAYMTLILMQLSLHSLEDTATKVQNGSLDGMESLGALMASGMFLKATADALDRPVPVSVLATAWDEAKEETAAIRDLYGRWSDKEIDSAKVLEALPSLKSRVDATVSDAEDVLAEEYDLSQADLDQMRKERLAALETSLQESGTEDVTPGVQTTSTPAPEEPGTSRAAPLPSGTTVRLKTWAVSITGVTRGEEAAAQLTAANQFNKAAPEGYEYLIASLRLENIGTEQKAQPVSYAIQLHVTGDRNIGYASGGAVPPTQLEGELFPGGVAEGQQVFVVPADETNLMFMVEEGFSMEEGAHFVAIDEGAIVTPDAALADLASTNAGTGRNAPAARDSMVRTDDWEVTIVDVLRGADAQAKLAEANQFNEPAPEGREYIVIKAKVRRIGSARPDTPAMIDGAMFRATGDKNVVYDRPSITGPEPRLEAQVFPGGEVEGWTVVEVATGEGNLAAVFEPIFSFDDAETRFLALE